MDSQKVDEIGITCLMVSFRVMTGAEEAKFQVAGLVWRSALS